jgi:medium-chain acyl-[acyl-carrier-protein] hydrolase
MEEMVTALAGAVAPYLDRPFAFFGHSMGAVIAFELARRLRREGKPLPAALFASAARAPQYRLGWSPPPEPSEQDLLVELQRLEGMPREVSGNRDLMRLILPVLRADAALYRDYVYSEEAPLSTGIRAYGGAQDPSITREQLEAWSLQSAKSFALRLFPGGHFFIQTASESFLAALSADLADLRG